MPSSPPVTGLKYSTDSGGNIIGLVSPTNTTIPLGEGTAAFSTTTSYKIGDQCTYLGSLYQFANAHLGAWVNKDAIFIQALPTTLTTSQSNSGIDIHEVISRPETFAAPIRKVGDRLSVGTKIFNKVPTGPSDTSYAYLLERPIDITASNLVFSTLNNANTGNNTYVGSIKVPGDALVWSGPVTLSVTVTATPGQDLANTMISVGFSTNRDQQKYRMTQTHSTGVGNTVTMTATLTPIHATKLQLSIASTANATVGYPFVSQIMDTNLMANVEFPIYFVYTGTSTQPPTWFVQSITATLKGLAPPAKFQYSPYQQYRDAALQPFPANDIWNTPLLGNLVAQPPVYTHLPTTNTGTINATGTSGAYTITVNTNASSVKPGMFPVISNITRLLPGSTMVTRCSAIGTQTLSTFGVGNTVVSVSGNTITLAKPLLSTLQLQGVDAFGQSTVLVFHTAPETVIARIGQTFGDMSYGLLTGKAGVSASATGSASKLSIYQTQPTDPIRNWTTSAVVATNGWLNTFTSSSVINSGEVLGNNMPYAVKTPAAINTAILNLSPDKNLLLVTENGKYCIDNIQTYFNSTTNAYTAGRSSVVNLYSPSVSYILNRPEFISSGLSESTRAYGGGLMGGIVRNHELARCPDSTATTETAAQIAANIATAMNAIPHALAIVMSQDQQKSNKYTETGTAGGQASLTTYYSYVSQFERHTPSVINGGTGYVVGDVLYVTGTTHTAPMRLAVTTVSAGGVVTGVFVVGTGQLKTLPPDGGNLATTSSGVGTGCVISVLATADTTITTTALAFPATTIPSVMQYPSTCVDSGWQSLYAGCVPMGAVFTIDLTEAQLIAMWTSYRTLNPALTSSSYELLAVLTAIRRYGAINVDTGTGGFVPLFVESTIPAQTYLNLTGTVVNFLQTNINTITNRLVYVENVTPAGKGVAGTPRAPYALPLYPINN